MTKSKLHLFKFKDIINIFLFPEKSQKRKQTVYREQ